jgi:hypothetical protein
MDNTLRSIGTPNNIEVLIHCHVTPLPHPRRNAPAVANALRLLRDLGAIEATEDGETTTALGRAWVEALCRVQMPRAVFVDGNGEVLS